jgi:hypothetical protein
MSDTVCPECRAVIVASARAALGVLADERTDTSARSIASDVLSEAAATLKLPTSGRCPE